MGSRGWNGDSTARSAATGAAVALSLPPALDAARASWTCFGAGNGATCTAEARGALIDDAISLPPHRQLNWLVTAPVRSDAGAALVEAGIHAAHGAWDADARDQTALVLMRSGFDAEGEDGAGRPLANNATGCDAAAPAMLPGGDGAYAFTLPRGAGRGFTLRTALRFSTDGGGALRVEHARLDGDFVRLVATAASGVESASRWVAAAPDASLLLDFIGQEALLEGTAEPLVLAFGEGPTGKAPAAIDATADDCAR